MRYKSVVGVQMDLSTKLQAKRILDELGLSMSEAIRLFFEQIVEEQRIPFECKDTEE